MGTYMFCFPGSSVCKDFPQCSVCKESTCDAGDPGLIPRLQRSPGEGNGNPSSILAWKIPWAEEPRRLQSLELKRDGYDWATSFALSFFISKYLMVRSKECNDPDDLVALADLPWNKDTVLLYRAIKYINTQALVEDARMWQSTWTNLHGWTCKRNFASLKVCL